MSTVAHPTPLAGPRSGGVAARRAVIRWAGRMFRREWRQQLLVLTLLSVAVTAAIGSVTIVSTVSATNSEFGSAVEPGAPPMAVGDTQVFPPVELVKRSGKTFSGQSQLYVATPAVLRYLGIDPMRINPGIDFLLDRSVAVNQLTIPSMTSRKLFPVTNVQKIDFPGICSAPTAAATRRTSSRSTVFAATAGSKSRPAGSSGPVARSRAARSPTPAMQRRKPGSRSRSAGRSTRRPRS